MEPLKLMSMTAAGTQKSIILVDLTKGGDIYISKTIPKYNKWGGRLKKKAALFLSYRTI